MNVFREDYVNKRLSDSDVQSRTPPVTPEVLRGMADGLDAECVDDCPDAHLVLLQRARRALLRAAESLDRLRAYEDV